MQYKFKLPTWKVVEELKAQIARYEGRLANKSSAPWLDRSLRSATEQELATARARLYLAELHDDEYICVSL